MGESFHLQVAADTQFLLKFKLCDAEAPITTHLVAAVAIALNAKLTQATAVCVKRANQQENEVRHRKRIGASLKAHAHAATMLLILWQIIYVSPIYVAEVGIALLYIEALEG